MRQIITPLVAALVLATSAVGFAVTVTTGGYVQFRYTDVSGQLTAADKVSGFEAVPTFGIRRARVSFKAVIDDQTSASVEIDASKSAVELKKAYLTYLTKYGELSAGRTNIPFGYEIPTSSSKLITLERAMIDATLPEYGTGIFFTPAAELFPATLRLAIINGDDPSRLVSGDKNTAFLDINANKLALANAEIKIFGDGKLGASYLTNGEARYAANGYVVLPLIDRLVLFSEYTANQFTDKLALPSTPATQRGYYVLAAYNVSQPLVLYGRYDALDTGAVTADKKHRETVGVMCKLSENSKLTVEYQFIHDQANPATHGALGAQVQTRW